MMPYYIDHGLQTMSLLRIRQVERIKKIRVTIPIHAML
jgi:hypothetical protein